MRLPPQHSQVPVPPVTRKGDVADNYHGTVIADPYRWLEDDNSAETATWVEAQNAITFAHLAGIPERAAIQKRLTALWNYERYSAPFIRAGKYFYFRNDGLQNQAVMYLQPTLDAPPSIVIDPNAFSPDGTVALSVAEVSPRGGWLVYGTTASGSDWQEFRIRDLERREDQGDRLEWIKFSGASWTPDEQGFFYGRYPEPASGEALSGTNRFMRLYYHRLGTPQDQDQLIYERPDQPDWGFGASVTDDGRYLAMLVWLGTDSRNRFYYVDLGSEEQPALGNPVVPLLDDFDAAYHLIDNDGPVFYFVTDLDAPRRRVIAVDTRNPGRDHWREIIPESSGVISSADVIGGLLVVDYLVDAHSVLQLFSLDGTLVREIPLPGIGTVLVSEGRKEDREMFYTFTSQLYPSTAFRYDFDTGESTIFKAPKVDFDPSKYVTTQVFYPSRDGTRIPMFITHRVDLDKDGANPTYLTGYGGFDISIVPAFSPGAVVWLEMGGILAEPNLRGGGEYGEEWHQAGMFEKKQNVFDDFIAAAEYLVREKYTAPARLAIAGGSNGGLLVGAAMTQRPDLFGAALPAVGVMDMLRFHRFTIGWAWVSEYGSADEASQFPYLLAYSPLHNLKPSTDYPATLITTADHDDRVVPAHSFKFAASLQAANAGRRPALIRVEVKAGHGAGKPISKVIEEQADRWGFLVRHLDMLPGLA